MKIQHTPSIEANVIKQSLILCGRYLKKCASPLQTACGPNKQ